MSPSQTQLEAGIARFNAGEFFAAHEHWEIDWKRLGNPDRPQIQAGILVCGVFVLLRKGRREPAIRLARKAIERFAEAAAQATLLGRAPRLRLPDAEERMLRFLARMQVAGPVPAGAEGDVLARLADEFSRGLRAFLVEGAGEA